MDSNEASSRPLDTFLKHREALVQYATPLVGDRMRAEDVVQEAWLRFSAANAKHRGDANPIAQPVAYLYRIVRNLAFDLARKLSAEAWHPSGEALLSEVPADIADPEQEAVARDQLQTLAAALDELPARTRKAFDLHRFDEKTFTEIGEVLGISQARAHGLVQEAVAHCMRRLARNERK
jgi:RNA polymerase sigma-70 factor (ECF subfamily)